MDRQPLELSFSKIQAYGKCPWLYHLVFEQGWRSGPNARQALGQSLHQTLAHYGSPDNKDRTLDRLLETYDSVWVNEGFDSVEETLEFYNKGQAYLEAFFQADQVRPDSRVATEAEFQLDVDGIQFRGTVDRIDRCADGSYSLIEYKTNADSWTPERVRSDLQMTLYNYGVQKGFGYKPLKLTYYFLSSGEFVETARTDSQTQEGLNLLFDVARRLKSGDLNPNHASCGSCEFKTRCTKSKLI